MHPALRTAACVFHRPLSSSRSPGLPHRWPPVSGVGLRGLPGARVFVLICVLVAGGPLLRPSVCGADHSATEHVQPRARDSADLCVGHQAQSPWSKTARSGPCHGCCLRFPRWGRVPAGTRSGFLLPQSPWGRPVLLAPSSSQRFQKPSSVLWKVPRWVACCARAWEGTGDALSPSPTSSLDGIHTRRLPPFSLQWPT